MKNFMNEHWAENIATSDENLNELNKLFQQSKLPSLPKCIFKNCEMHGPTAAVFSVVTENGNVTIKRNEVEVINQFGINSPIKTFISPEALTDMKRQYGEDGMELLSNYLKGLANDFETAKCIEFLDDNAVSNGLLTLPDATSPSDVWERISYKTTECILKMNSKNIRTYEAFVVMPYTVGASIMSMFGGMDNAELADQTKLFVGSSGLTSWYINPDQTVTDIFVGLKDDTGTGRNCAYFSTYTKEITYAVDPESGDTHYFIWDRFALTMNPSHTNDNPMLMKFSLS